MKLAFALMAAINAGFTKTEARRASWRPRSDSRFSLADSESGTAAIRPAWATMGKPGRSTTDSRFDPIVCSQAASNRSDACSDSAQGRSLVDGNDMRVARQKRESAADACARLRERGGPGGRRSDRRRMTVGPQVLRPGGRYRDNDAAPRRPR